MKPVALLLTPVVPRPTGSGLNLRAWAWLTELSADYQVHVLVFQNRADEPEPGFPGASIRFFCLRPPNENRGRRLVAKLLPFLVCLEGFGGDWVQSASKPVLDGIADPQLIVVFRLYLHDAARPLLDQFAGARRIMDLDDLESRSRLSIALAQLQMGRLRDALRELTLAVQYRVAERFLVPRYYNSACLAAPEDCSEVAGGGRVGVTVFRNRLGGPETMETLPAKRLLFVGSLGYPPNELAARWLLQMAPELAKRFPKLKLTIVGRGASESLQHALRQCQSLDYFDDVDSLSQYFAATLAVLVPLRAGGGTKLKTIEAFAYARPVISTREGVRGLGAIAGQHYLPAETSSQFVAAVERISADDELADRLSRDGHSLWRAEFSL